MCIYSTECQGQVAGVGLNRVFREQIGGTADQRMGPGRLQVLRHTLAVGNESSRQTGLDQGRQQRAQAVYPYMCYLELWVKTDRRSAFPRRQNIKLAGSRAREASRESAPKKKKHDYALIGRIDLG